MKSTVVALALIGGMAASVFAQVSVEFKGVPLDLALVQYGQWTDTTLEVVRGVDAQITLSAHDIPLAEAVMLLGEELKKQNIGLFPIASNRIVATWIDQSKAPPPPQRRRSYAERLRERRLAEERRMLDIKGE